MNPLESLKNWYVAVFALLAGCGIVALIFLIVKALVFLVKHIQLCL